MSEKHWSIRLRFKFPHCVTPRRQHEQRDPRGKHSQGSSAFVAALVFFAWGLTSACAVREARPAPPPGAKTTGMAPGSKPGSTELSRTVITPHSATDIQALFDKATADGQAKHYEDAASGFERAFQLDPDGPLADRSLFESAEMYDLAGKHDEALARYEQVTRRFPKSPLDRVARVRALRLLTYLERYARAGELAETTAAKYNDLASFDQLAVLAARALSRLAVDDDAQAETAISKARDIIEAENLDAAGRVPAELAPIYFALGELRRVRAERIHFVPVPTNFGAALEQRCQLLLDAQGAYSDAMRAYDAHWSAMAGFRVGELYASLHHDLMQVSPPASADTLEKKQLFEGAMRLRYAILLEKAEHMLEHTLSMASRTGEQSVWVERSRETMTSIHEASEREQAAIAALPFSRSVLEAALADLSRRAEEKERRESQKRGGTAK